MQYNNMYNLIKNEVIMDDKPIIHYYNSKISKKDFFDKIERLSTYLYNQGIKKGDVVTICLPNIPCAIYAIYATNKIGAIANLVHPLMPALGLVKILKETKSKILFHMDNFYMKGLTHFADYKTILCNLSDEMAMPYRPIVKLATRKIKKYISKNCKNTIYYTNCLNDKKDIDVQTNLEDIAVYLHSGGTTGSPKTIKLSNRSLNSCAINTGSIIENRLEGFTLMILPLFHGFGLGVTMHTSLYKGAGLILIPRFNPDKSCKLLKKYEVTLMSGVPQMYAKIMRSKHFKGKHLKNLKYMYCGGDSLKNNIKEEWDSTLKEFGNDCELQQGYGLTEMLSVTHVNRPGLSKKGTLGNPIVGTYQKIVDENGNTLKPNECGEILLSGANMMSGYLNDNKTTNEIMTKDKNGKVWIHTGDCGYIDDENFLYFKERIKRMVKISGINVFPQEIESVVSNIDEIEHSCAIETSVNDKPAIKLYVVTRNNKKLDEILKDKITSYISKRLMKYSVPKIIEQKDKLPLTLIGKVDFRKLSEKEKEVL